MKKLFVSVLLVFLCLNVFPSNFLEPGDTTFVQCFSFDDISSRRAWFDFPEQSNWNKILMYYTIKCDPATPWDGYQCGEWDYTTYTHIYDHTGLIDSTEYVHPYFTVNGLSPDSFGYGNSQAWDYFPFSQSSWNVSDTNSLSVFEFGTGSESLSFGDVDDAKTLFIYTAEELNNQGLSAGIISELKFQLSQEGLDFRHIRVRGKHVLESNITSDFADTLNMSQLYDSPTSSVENGWVNCLFYPGFDWDGTSNILIEISYVGASQNVEYMTDPMLDTMMIFTNSEDKYLKFNGSDYLEVPADAFESVEQSITISLWVNGDSNIQPQNDMLFEGQDIDGNRVLNVHLPWSDGNVYWDAGNNGSSYDRISAAANSEEYAGRWNHWAFVKDASVGSMEIYLNGELWQSGSNKTYDMSGISRFVLGGDKNLASTNFYDGLIDEFRVWNTALDEEKIREWMYKECDDTHPNWGNLMVYYSNNYMQNGVVSDLSANTYNAYAIGMPSLKSYEGINRFKNFNFTNLRPHCILEQGDFVQTDTTIWYADSIVADQNCLRLYEVDDYRLFPMDTSYVWGNYYRYSYNSQDGSVIDSVLVLGGETILQNNLVYYSEPFDIINTIQVQNFVTPYGINLDLDDDGFTYVYDVTDYVGLLHDSVDIQAHNTQELLDLKFAFIEGTPPREVLDFKQIWRGQYGHHAIAEEEVLPGVKVKMLDDAHQFIVRTRTTGHGMDEPAYCAEFCPTYHNLFIDGVQRYEWKNWKECSDNPVYPQGGTWVFDRAGWCPGSFADTYNWDVSEFVNPGDSVNVDYGMQQYPVGDGEGNYRLTVQCFQYGEPNFQNDASIDNILKPSKDDQNRRFNPICGQPEIRIQNTGAQTLTSLHIEYGIDGDLSYYYDWSGSLEFMQKEDVILPAMDWNEVINSEGLFTVEISSPNSQSDEFEGNNLMKSEIELVDVIDKPIMITLMTNNIGSETSYEILNGNGEVIKSVNNLNNSTQYYDTIPYNPGCYEIRIYDEGEDGLSYWYNTAAGNGSIGLRYVGGSFAKHFDPDFGSFIRYQFIYPDADYINTNLANGDYFSLYPNPASDLLTVEMNTVFSQKADIRIYDMFGKELIRKSVNTSESSKYELNISELPEGVYLLRMINGKLNQTKKFVVK